MRPAAGASKSKPMGKVEEQKDSRSFSGADQHATERAFDDVRKEIGRSVQLPLKRSSMKGPRPDANGLEREGWRHNRPVPTHGAAP